MRRARSERRARQSRHNDQDHRAVDSMCQVGNEAKRYRYLQNPSWRNGSGASPCYAGKPTSRVTPATENGKNVFPINSSYQHQEARQPSRRTAGTPQDQTQLFHERRTSKTARQNGTPNDERSGNTKKRRTCHDQSELGAPPRPPSKSKTMTARSSTKGLSSDQTKQSVRTLRMSRQNDTA